VDSEVARVEDDLLAGDPVEVEGRGAFQDAAVEAHVEIQL
jgi:hypothetical protein